MGPGACCFGWVGGVALGGLAGLALALVLERVHTARRVATSGAPSRLSPPSPSSSPWAPSIVLFGGCSFLLPEAGLPAAITAGMVVGLSLETAAESLDALIAQLAILAITVLFPLLAADAFWQELSPLGLGGVGGVLDCHLNGLVFLMMLMNVGVGGVTAPWLAKALGLNGAETAPEGDAPLAAAGDLIPR